MKKFRVRLTRLVEEECDIYVDAEDFAAATDLAIDAAEEVADAIWLRSNSAPDTYAVESVIHAERLTKHTE